VGIDAYISPWGTFVGIEDTRLTKMGMRKQTITDNANTGWRARSLQNTDTAIKDIIGAILIMSS
jgi:hypothetical protein